MNKDYYQILGVLEDADEVVIRAAYKALAQRYHPDKWSGDSDTANKRMSEINEAYKVLSNPIERSRYDSNRQRATGNRADKPVKENPKINIPHKKWLLVLIFTLLLLGLFIGFVYERSSLPIKSFNDISLGSKREEIEFKFGKLESLQKPEKALQIKGTQNYVYFNDANRVDAIAYVCLESDLTNLHKIKCGDSADSVQKILGKSLVIMCEVESGQGLDPARSYSSADHGIKVILRRNKVQILGILEADKLVNPANKHWVPCK